MNNIYSENADDTISFYEFRDGDLDISQRSGHYTYSIILKFRDPFLDFMVSNLFKVRTIIKNLDELLHKLSLKMEDPQRSRKTKIYNNYDPRGVAVNLSNMVDLKRKENKSISYD